MKKKFIISLLAITSFSIVSLPSSVRADDTNTVTVETATTYLENGSVPEGEKTNIRNAITNISSDNKEVREQAKSDLAQSMNEAKEIEAAHQKAKENGGDKITNSTDIDKNSIGPNQSVLDNIARLEKERRENAERNLARQQAEDRAKLEAAREKRRQEIENTKKNTVKEVVSTTTTTTDKAKVTVTVINQKVKKNDNKSTEDLNKSANVEKTQAKDNTVSKQDSKLNITNKASQNSENKATNKQTQSNENTAVTRVKRELTNDVSLDSTEALIKKATSITLNNGASDTTKAIIKHVNKIFSDVKNDNLTKDKIDKKIASLSKLGKSMSKSERKDLNKIIKKLKELKKSDNKDKVKLLKDIAKLSKKFK